MKKIHKFVVASILVSMSGLTFAAKDVSSSKVNYIYQLDSEATVFEFNATVAHACGSSTYRVKSPNEAVAGRKFSMILTAFTTKGNIAFHDTGVCESGRSVVSWVRITQ